MPGHIKCQATCGLTADYRGQRLQRLAIMQIPTKRRVISSQRQAEIPSLTNTYLYTSLLSAVDGIGHAESAGLALQNLSFALFSIANCARKKRATTLFGTQFILRTPPTTLKLAQHAASQQIVDVAQCSICRALAQRGPFGVAELAFKAV
jgi:hypothetical protein